MAESLYGMAAISYPLFLIEAKKVARDFPFPIFFPHFVKKP